MTRVLVIGGYGGFGLRIARRLAADGWQVLVAGRSLAKAQAACAGTPGLTALAFDRNSDTAAVLAKLRPFAVIDAAGPFQGASYALAQACIAQRCHYLDIADGRDFVAGIGAHDAAAQAAGVTVISGASSVPALSGAVVRELALDLTELRAIEIAISASNRATAGVSVSRAIFSYVGRPFSLWRHRRRETGYGWQGLQRADFRVAGEPPIAGRLIGFADVPDLALLPDRLPSRPAVSFRAGTELTVQNIMVWTLSWLVRWGLVKQPERLLPPLLRLQALTARLGSDRSAMIVRAFGLRGEQRCERRWTLIARDGCGPEIPCLAVPILLRRLREGALAPGACDAGPLLTLADFAPVFATMPVRDAITDHTLPPPLYARVMGTAFDALPPRVRAMHDVLRDHGATGQAVVSRGRSRAARMIATLFGFPPEGEHDLHVGFDERDGVETWTRDFGGRMFRSRLSQRGELLVEAFGPLRFGFTLPANGTGLTMRLQRWWLGPLPLPLALAPRSEAREWQADDRFQFDVPIALPLIGLIVHYRGWLA
ncbi:SDR family oxidoreductase [Bradyrhizobium sp. 2TAF24]|uniref:SDR family oxidoreductase n=1 Tax=Bradyrhizobium sp. 2TAF24 TaxID=3233011 RepID=UPI003F8EC65A